MRGIPIELPECGLFLGNGVYPMSEDYYVSALLTHRTWISETTTPQQMIDRIMNDNQGNLAQVWGHGRGNSAAMHDQWFYALDEIGVTIPEPDWDNDRYVNKIDTPEFTEHADRFGAGLVRFVKLAAAKGIYTTFIYTAANPKWSHQLQSFGKFYLGYDFGETFTFRFDQANAKGLNHGDITLKVLADNLMERVKTHVDEYHHNGWGNVAATSGNFYIDLEVAAGAEIPMAEDFAFRHLDVASAISRGLYKQFDLPTWGTHLAHEHYSWIPGKSPYKFPLLRASLYHKYMAGAKIIVNESGNWFAEASLCEDSPKFDMPVNPLTVAQVKNPEPGSAVHRPYINEAREHYHKLGPDTEHCRSYRKEISDFYDYVKANGTPQGQPEVTVALAKGHLDLGGYGYGHCSPVGGMYELSERNPMWLAGPPEVGWDIVREVFFPLREVMSPYPNHFLSGTPYGQTDIVSFVNDLVTPEFLIAHYKVLIFAGWNTCSPKQYETLKTYVKLGGTLFISIPHLSTNVTRNHSAYHLEELVNQGDFSDLCGVKVKGKGRRFYWAVAKEGSTELGFAFPRRFGTMRTCMGDIEITGDHVETLVVDDEHADPILLRSRMGKGQVYFLNSWAYPGALNNDHGPGARVPSKGLIGMIFEHLAQNARGSVWITDDGERTAQACEYMAFSWFPESHQLCLQNIDFKHAHTIYLHQQGLAPERITLKPLEFMMRSSVPAMTT